MRGFLKYFFLAIILQIVLNILSWILIYFTRNDIFGWIPGVYIGSAGLLFQYVTGIEKDSGTILSLIGLSMPFIIIGLIFASIAYFILGKREKFEWPNEE